MATLPAAPGAYGHPPSPPAEESKILTPCLSPSGDVRERRAARVVEVEREARERHARVHAAPDDLGHLCGNADADRVADRHLVAPRVEQPARDAGGRGRRDRALVRAAEAHDTYPRTRIPASRARRITGAKRANDSSIEALMFFRLNVSDAAVKTAISRAPAASARSSPFSFGTRTG